MTCNATSTRIIDDSETKIMFGHEIDQCHYDRGLEMDIGHCLLCGKWIDTSTGEIIMD